MTTDKITSKPDLPPIRLRTKIIGGAIFLALIAICTVGSLNPGRTPDGLDAEKACQNFVRDRLKSPASAHFSGLARSGGGGSWTIAGDVDADNSFGAPVRSHFTCRVQLRDGYWYLQSLTGLQ